MPQDRLDPILRFEKNDPNSKSVTQQQFRDECDINIITRKYEQNGTLPETFPKNEFFGDFSAVPDFQEMQNLTIAVQTSFNMLPASTRARFNHSPSVALDFLSDSKNTEEAYKLGMVSETTFQEYIKATALEAPPQAPAGAESTPVVKP